MRETAFKSSKKLAKQIERYFAECELSREEIVLKNGDKRIREKTPTIIGLAVFLGVSKDTIYSYLNGEPKVSNQVSIDEQKAISDTLRNARDRIESALVSRAIDGDCDTRTASLLLSSYGYSTKIESNQTISVTIDGTDTDVGDWSK